VQSAYRRVVAADHHVEPDIGVRADLHIADHHRVGRDKRARVDARQDVAVGQDDRASHGIGLHLRPAVL
jgi:hypothetical protein